MNIQQRMVVLRRQLYSQLFDVLGERGLRALYAPRFAGLGVILMFHRVMLPDETTLYPGYTVSTTALESCLEQARKAGWKFVSLDEMRARLLDPDPVKERFACFTFDDGYQDNYTLALPIFRKYNAPMGVYVCTSLVDRTMFYWWGALEYLVLSREQIVLDLPGDPRDGQRVATVTIQEKLKVFGLIDGWCHSNPSIAPDALRRLFVSYDVDDRALLHHDALTSAQLQEMARDPLVTIGSHGSSHRRMSLLSAAELSDELVTSRLQLEAATSRAVRHLAYPFGSRNACGGREFQAAEASGYSTAVTTRRGNLFAEHRGHLWSLPRREASPLGTAARNALYGVSSILRRDPVMVID